MYICIYKSLGNKIHFVNVMLSSVRFKCVSLIADRQLGYFAEYIRGEWHNPLNGIILTIHISIWYSSHTWVSNLLSRLSFRKRILRKRRTVIPKMDTCKLLHNSIICQRFRVRPCISFLFRVVRKFVHLARKYLAKVGRNCWAICTVLWERRMHRVA